jgi:protein gp37
MGSPRYAGGFEFALQRDKIDEPLGWRKPRKVFVNSMSDLFHEHTPNKFIRQVFTVMQRASWHQFQVLTKRPERMRDVLMAMMADGEYHAAPNIWVGTSVEDMAAVPRLDALRQVPAAVRFLSCEPLLGPLGDLDLRGIHWVIVGGESGGHLWEEDARERRALTVYEDGRWVPRPECGSWVQSIQRQCADSDVAFFFKQWGGARPKAAGRLLDGRVWDEYPFQVAQRADRRADDATPEVEARLASASNLA